MFIKNETKKNMSNSKKSLVDIETQNLLNIIKLRELYRFGSVLVHYRYDFTPRRECSVEELAWGFVKDPWFAKIVAEKIMRLLPDIREEPPLFVKEWNNLGKTTSVKATMDIEVVTKEFDDLPPLEDDQSNDELPLLEDYLPSNDDLPPLEVDDDELPPLEPIYDDIPDLVYLPPFSPKKYDDRRSSIERMLMELSEFRIAADSNEDPFQNDDDFSDSSCCSSDESSSDDKDADSFIDKHYKNEFENMYTDYVFGKLARDMDAKERRATLNESIERLKKTAREITIEQENVCPNELTSIVVEIPTPVAKVATYSNVVMPIPQRAVLNQPDISQSDDVLVRVFTEQDLKWNGGPDLANPSKLPEKQCFRMPKNSTWGENLWEEVGHRTNILDDHQKDWCAFLFSKRVNGTIRPTLVMDDYVPLSVYQKKLDVNNEVWILVLNTKEPKEDEVVIHKKWFQKGWFYYQGFQLVKKSDKLSTAMNYDIAFEEVSALGSERNICIQLLNPSSSFRDLGLSTGDIIISSKMTNYLNYRGAAEFVNAETIAEAFDTINNLRPHLFKVKND